MTQRLVAFAATHWVRFDGEATMAGIDLLTLPIDRFLNTIYYIATKDATEAERAKFDGRLWVPPVGTVPTVGPWSPEAETQAFEAVKAALGAGPKPKSPT